MKYQEDLYIEREEGDLEVIRLYDLNLELVYDYVKDEHHIQLLELDSGRFLTKFPYGDEFNMEGFSFVVSPRHNYLIIKEMVEGISLDDLYATVYCLKDLKTDEPRNAKELGGLEAPRFHSYYHLTFHFSNDAEESTIMLTGQEVAELALIDEYQFGDYELVDNDPHKRLARFYKAASYPRVKLDNRIRDGKYCGRLTQSDVVNALDTIEMNQRKSGNQLELPYNFNEGLTKLLKHMPASNDQKIIHTVFSNDRHSADVKGFETQLRLLGLEYSTASEKLGFSQVNYFNIVVPFTSEASLFAQSVRLFNSLVDEHGMIYEGFKLAQANHLESWSDALNSAFSQYQFLAQCVQSGAIKAEYFGEVFHPLEKKHDNNGLLEAFTERQQDAISDVELALSNFDGWDIKEPELKQIIEASFLES